MTQNYKRFIYFFYFAAQAGILANADFKLLLQQCRRKANVWHGIALRSGRTLIVVTLFGEFAKFP